LSKHAPHPEQARTVSGILHVVDSLERGGLERLVNDLAIAQHQAGQRALVFSLNHTDGYKAELEAHGVPVIVGGKQGGFDLKLLAKLRHAMAASDIQVVHAHNFVPSYYAAAAMMGLAGRPAQVVTCHDMGFRLDNRRLRQLFLLSLKRVQGVAMVGQQVYQRFVGDGMVPADKAMTVLNAVPMTKYTAPAAHRAAARLGLGLSQQDLVIGCVGRLVPLKNHQLLIRCLPELVKHFPQLKLVLIGDGPVRDELADQGRSLGVAQHIVFAGLREQVDTLLPALDVFALPSTTEGVSIALLEACACGLAVVASRVGGNVGHSGLLFASQDQTELHKALMTLLESAELRQAMGARARQWAQANASLEALAERYQLLYVKALSRLYPDRLTPTAAP